MDNFRRIITNGLPMSPGKYRVYIRGIPPDERRSNSWGLTRCNSPSECSIHPEPPLCFLCLWMICGHLAKSLIEAHRVEYAPNDIGRAKFQFSKLTWDLRTPKLWDLGTSGRSLSGSQSPQLETRDSHYETLFLDCWEN